MAAQSIDAADCRHLLDLLGLFPDADADFTDTAGGAGLDLLTSSIIG
ncbi:hypothetical protein [Embleya sp. NPDC001921]